VFRAAAVIGHPIAHSRSPLVHGYWLATHGIDGAYLRHDVSPNDVVHVLRRLPDHGLVGVNVTLPHKEAALTIVDDVDAVAQAIGAVNTIWRDGERLVGTNTDAAGFLANLDNMASGWDHNRDIALVFGAGGSARAVVYALAMRGFARIAVANRTLARAEALCRRFGPRVHAVALDEVQRVLSTADVVINTTSMELVGDDALSIDWTRARESLVANDIVYVPLETPFLARARGRGLRTVDGLGMLLHQAVPGFEKWFGVRPTVTSDLRALLIADIGRA
jgi:shikimate dehydrogenase